MYERVYRNGIASRGFGTAGIFDVIAKPFKAVAKVASNAVSTVEKTAAKIPVAGDLINIANKAVTAPVRIASDVVSGKNVLDVAKNAIAGQVEYIQKMAPYVQSALPMIPAGQMTTILSKGQEAIASVPALSTAAKTVSGAAQTQGFQLAAGLVKTGAAEKLVSDVRSKLSADVVKGFDAALKAQGAFPNIIGKTAAAAAQAGAKALAALTPAQQQELVNYANLQKLAQLSPDQQRQLVDYAKANAPKAAAAPAKSAPAPVVRPKLSAAPAPKKTAGAPAPASAAATAATAAPGGVPTRQAPAAVPITAYAPYPSH